MSWSVWVTTVRPGHRPVFSQRSVNIWQIKTQGWDCYCDMWFGAFWYIHFFTRTAFLRLLSLWGLHIAPYLILYVFLSLSPILKFTEDKWFYFCFISFSSIKLSSHHSNILENHNLWTQFPSTHQFFWHANYNLSGPADAAAHADEADNILPDKRGL